MSPSGDDKTRAAKAPKRKGCRCETSNPRSTGKIREALVLAPGVPLTHRAALDGGAGAANGRPGHRRHRADIRAARERMRRIRPLSRSPAATGNGTTTSLTAHHSPAAAGRSRRRLAAISAPRSWTLQPPRGRHARTHVIELTSYQIDLAPSLETPAVGILYQAVARTIPTATAPWSVTRRSKRLVARRSRRRAGSGDVASTTTNGREAAAKARTPRHAKRSSASRTARSLPGRLSSSVDAPQAGTAHPKDPAGKDEDHLPGLDGHRFAARRA